MRRRAVARSMRALGVLMALVLAGCLEGGSPALGDPVQVAFRDVSLGQDSAIKTPLREVVADAAAWADLWARHRANDDPVPPAPEVDFSRERVVAVAMGERGSGCFALRIDSVERASDGRVTVRFTSYSFEGAGRVCTAVMTQPHHFVAVEDTTGDVSFVETTSNLPPPSRGTMDSEPTPTTIQTSSGGVEPLSLRTLAQGSDSGADETRQRFRDEASWRAFWSKHAARQLPPPDAPRAEWGNESVVAVVLAEKTSGCWGVRVTNASYESGARRTVVEVTTYAPGPGMMCTSALTRPYHFVALPDRPGDVSFVERETTGGAGAR